MSKTVVNRNTLELEEEIHRVLEHLENIGIRNATRNEAQHILVEKHKRARISDSELRNILLNLRGLR